MCQMCDEAAFYRAQLAAAEKQAAIAKAQGERQKADSKPEVLMASTGK